MCDEAAVSESQLRIPLGDCRLVCDGFRLRVAGRPSLEFDGDLLWAIEHGSWQPLAVELHELAEGMRVRPLPLERQPAFDAQRALDWRGDEVHIQPLPPLRDAAGVRDWYREHAPHATLSVRAFEFSEQSWGRLLRVDCRAAGLGRSSHEHFLFPLGRACVHLGHLALDWRRLYVEPIA